MVVGGKFAGGGMPFVVAEGEHAARYLRSVAGPSGTGVPCGRRELERQVHGEPEGALVGS